MIIMACVVVLMGLFTLLSTPALADQPALNAPTASSLSYQLNWDVTGSGGATMQSASYTMFSTTGQTMTTPMSGSTYTMKNGFWSGVFEDIYKIFLPLITK